MYHLKWRSASGESEKLVKIIIPDLLNYLEMAESGEIIEKRLQKKLSTIQKHAPNKEVEGDKTKTLNNLS